MAGEKHVPAGVWLKCDLGSTTQQLIVEPRTIKLYDESWAVETDALPIKNIPSFGACAKIGTCLPATTMWSYPVDGNMTVVGRKPIKDTSICQCNVDVAGKISIFFDRQAAADSVSSDAATRAANAMKEESEILFWAAVGAAVIIGAAAIVLSGGAAAPLVIAAAELAMAGAATGAIIGGGVGVVAGGIEGYAHTGTVAGTAKGAAIGGAMGAGYGAVGGAMVATGNGALLLPSAAAFVGATALDGVAFYYEPTPENGLVFVADLIVLGGAKAGEKATAKLGLGEPVRGGRGPSGAGETKGKYSGRNFNASKAGGAIEKFSWKDTTINKEGVKTVKKHLSRFEKDSANKKMIERLDKIEKGEMEVTDYDKKFYTHEIREYERYKNLGIEDGVDPGYDIWNDTHSATLEDYQLSDYDSNGNSNLYHPETW